MIRKTKKPLIIGNWKQNPVTLDKAKSLLLELRKRLRSKRNLSCEIGFAPPLTFLSDLNKLAPTGRFRFYAQHVSPYDKGAHTGEVSASMVASVGASGVIVGHSERRADGLDDEEVSSILSRVLALKLEAVLCVGEKKRDASGHFYDIVEEQLNRAFSGVSSAKASGVVIAYEPVWAIGSGTTATAEDVLEMKLFIKKIMIGLFGRNVAEKVRVLYGGSVDHRNASSILLPDSVDGFLVGGASLKPDSFLEIVDSLDKHVKYVQ